VTRRLVVVIVLTVVGTLLVAGLTTVLIARWQAREATESVLREQAESLAVTVSQLDPALPARQPGARTVLRALRRALRVDGVEFVRLTGDGTLTGVLPTACSPPISTWRRSPPGTPSAAPTDPSSTPRRPMCDGVRRSWSS
jgi:hypothetical protein